MKVPTVAGDAPEQSGHAESEITEPLQATSEVVKCRKVMTRRQLQSRTRLTYEFEASETTGPLQPTSSKVTFRNYRTFYFWASTVMLICLSPVALLLIVKMRQRTLRESDVVAEAEAITAGAAEAEAITAGAAHPVAEPA
jgi:hypothetical protein